MGNCLAPESTRTKSRPRCAVVPRGLQVNEQEKRQPLQAAHEPRKRVKGTPERPKRSVRFEDYDGGKKEVVREPSPTGEMDCWRPVLESIPESF
ncbi:hypothetical protein OPV22_018419 [Ensete ventricosum]|uniref:Uncharacterized protein n=1 Tax=Ensete ventricosum TaxID=4639 RepID=A0AAV8QQG3_ENSVE|nr:hypothetical protein OPV22_018419 [Ensete ventricosum]